MPWISSALCIPFPLPLYRLLLYIYPYHFQRKLQMEWWFYASFMENKGTSLSLAYYYFHTIHAYGCIEKCRPLQFFIRERRCQWFIGINFGWFTIWYKICRPNLKIPPVSLMATNMLSVCLFNDADSRHSGETRLSIYLTTAINGTVGNYFESRMSVGRRTGMPVRYL